MLDSSHRAERERQKNKKNCQRERETFSNVLAEIVVIKEIYILQIINFGLVWFGSVLVDFTIL